jgi:SnoaL-like domain
MSHGATLKEGPGRSLARWHAMLADKNLSDLPSIVHEDAEFRSPMSFNGYRSRNAVLLALGTVSGVFEDFKYHREAYSSDGNSVVLEFSARIGDKQLKGVDLVRFDDDGLIVEFEVMVRPLNALQALGAMMTDRIGRTMPSYKAPAGRTVPTPASS